MGTPRDILIEAAGGVLWRGATGGSGVEVALVHRPKYDDWSLPKGKLRSDEHPIVGAVREVAEETGYESSIGVPLGQIRYLKDGAPKRVRYWAMLLESGTFTPTDEVDQLMWLPPREAKRHLTPDRDQPVLEAFEGFPGPTVPVVLLRHGSAGERAEWSGDDRERPLDEVGRRQAEALVEVLSVMGIRRILSADVLRCLETVGPYAEAAQVTVESEPLMSEAGAQAQPDAAAARFEGILRLGEPVVVCTQKRTLQVLFDRVDLPGGGRRGGAPAVRKGGFCTVHVAPHDHAKPAELECFGPVV